MATPRKQPERKLTVKRSTSPTVRVAETLTKVLRLRGYDVPAYVWDALQETARLLEAEQERKKLESAKRQLRKAGERGALYY